MYAHLLPFEKKTIQKGPLSPIFKRSSSIHKNNPALVASNCVDKKYTSTVFVRFLKIHLISRVLVRSLKKPNFTR